MDYLIDHWPWVSIFAFLVLAAVVDELWFRLERRRVRRANMLLSRANAQQGLPEYLDEDDLLVISNDTDEVVYEGSPAATYDWLMINGRYGTYDVHNQGTVKTVTSTQFMEKYIA